ncbi:MAG: zinc-ribbon domain-containing protein [Persicimonas sp.]
MIVRCPECSTGFKLPDDQLSTEGVKLRCSKCKHVFRFRETEDGDTEVFYRDSDRERNESGASSDDDDEEPRELERSGAPGLRTSKKSSKSASSDYNPFPHANLSDDDESDRDTDDESGGGLDLGDDEDDDPFDGAFDDEEDDEDEDILQPRSAPGQSAPSGPPGGKPPQAAQPAGVGASAPTNAGPPPGAQTGPKESAADQAPATGGGENSDVFAQQDSPYRPEEMVDPSFGSDGPSFDPDQGVVDEQQPSGQAQSPPGGQRPNQPAGAAQSPRTQRRQQAASESAGAQSFGATTASTTHTAQGAAESSSWTVDEEPEQPIEPHTVGGSGLQKFANLLLITLIVGIGFFGVIAFLSGGFIDFQRFDHMLEVAFDDAEFEPRSDWVDEGPAVVPAPEDPVRFEAIFATPLKVGDDRVILLRGRAKNVGEDSYPSAKVRGILRDSDERVITETTAPLGADLIPSELSETESLDEALDKMPEETSGLEADDYETFSLIFDEVPEGVFQDLDVTYKVETVDAESDE